MRRTEEEGGQRRRGRETGSEGGRPRRERRGTTEVLE